MLRVWSQQLRVTFWAWLATVGAATMIAPLVEGRAYLWQGAAGAAVVAAVGAAARARRLPWSAIVLIQLAALTEWCIVAYARDEALLGIVPTPGAFAALGNRVVDFVALTQQYAAPIPSGSDVTVTLALVMIALALLVDVVAVTWRKVPLLGLVFLAIYMVPVALLGGEVSMFAFLPGAAGFVFLLAADERERLTHWGRQISTGSSLWDDPADQVNHRGITTSGRRIGLGAVAAAVVLPVVLPALSPHYFGQSGSGGDDGTGDGDSDRTMVTNPVLDLQRNLSGQSEAILVRFSTDQPDPGYLRLASLDVFTDDSWMPGVRGEFTGVPSDGTLPAVPGVGSAVPRTGYHYDVEISDELDSTWLPLVYAPTRINADQRWTVDQTSLDATAIAEEQSTAGTRYSFDAVLYQPTAALLRAANDPPPALARFTELPEGLPPVIEEQARAATAGAKTPFDQALALQSWFRSRGGFEYSLDAAAGTGMETIERFLTDDRVGYCEQFASAMALMARTLDIPTRVAVGFLRPESVAGDEYAYRGTDMHTWPELYFEGAGWVRFEPTPAGDPPDFTNNQGNANSTATGGPTDRSRPSNNANKLKETAGAAATEGSDGSGPWSGYAAAPVLAALVLLLGATPRLLRRARTRARWNAARRPVESAEAAWSELRDSVLDLRMHWDSQLTPRGMGRQLRTQVAADDGFVRALNRIVLACEQGRYARSVREPGELRQAVATVVTALAATRSARAQWLARWLPASLLTSLDRRRGDGARQTGGAVVTVAE